MASRYEWRVYASYVGRSAAMDDAIEAAAGIGRDGAGSGLGSRDIDFTFRTRKAALAAVDRIAAIPGVTVEAHRSEVEEEETGE